MPSPSTLKAVLWALLIVTLILLARAGIDRLRARESENAVRMEVSEPVRQLRRVDSVTGLPLRRIPTDLGGEVLFTDTLGER